MAGVTIGSATYAIEVEQAGFRRGLDEARRTAETSTRTIGRAFDGVRSQIGSAFSGIGSTVTSAFSAIPNAIGGAVRSLGAFGLAAEGVRAAISSIGSGGNLFGVGALSEIEQVRARFTAFTGSAEEAERILAAVRKEAALTPFSFAELAKATAALLPASKQANISLDELTKTAQILAALNPAQGLEGAAFSLREAVSGDFVSIVERFDLPRQRLNEFKAQGVPAVKAIQQVLKEMGVDASLVAKQGETLSAPFRRGWASRSSMPSKTV